MPTSRLKEHLDSRHRANVHVNNRRPRERNVSQDTREAAWITPREYPDDVDVLQFKRTRARTFPRPPTCTILSCPTQDDICPTPQRMIVYSQETDCADPRRGFSLSTLPVVSTANQTTGQWKLDVYTNSPIRILALPRSMRRNRIVTRNVHVCDAILRRQGKF